MDITDFLGIAVVGAALSFVAGLIKTKFGTTGNVSKLLVVGLSVVVGGLYFWLRSTLWWTTILGVLASASTVYALVRK